MSKDNGGSAFPNKAEQCNFGYELSGGMTLRDAFAKEAMQAAMSGHISHYGHDGYGWPLKEMAQYAYEMADAMLEARQK